MVVVASPVGVKDAQHRADEDVASVDVRLDHLDTVRAGHVGICPVGLAAATSKGMRRKVSEKIGTI